MDLLSNIARAISAGAAVTRQPVMQPALAGAGVGAASAIAKMADQMQPNHLQVVVSNSEATATETEDVVQEPATAEESPKLSFIEVEEIGEAPTESTEADSDAAKEEEPTETVATEQELPEGYISVLPVDDHSAPTTVQVKAAKQRQNVRELEQLKAEQAEEEQRKSSAHQRTAKRLAGQQEIEKKVRPQVVAEVRAKIDALAPDEKAAVESYLKDDLDLRSKVESPFWIVRLRVLRNRRGKPQVSLAGVKHSMYYDYAKGSNQR